MKRRARGTSFVPAESTTYICIYDTKAIILNRPGSATTPCCKRKQQVRRCFYFYPFALYVAVFSFFAIRRSFACCEGALAATAVTAAAAAVCCSVSLIVSVLCVMFCLLCCLICVILGVLLCYYSCDIWSCWNILRTRYTAAVCRDHRAF